VTGYQLGFETTKAFQEDFSKLPPTVQVAVTAEIHLIARFPSEHGSIYMAGWDDPVRWVNVSKDYWITWTDGDPVTLGRILHLPDGVKTPMSGA
jgi:hypothetical protein